VVELGDEAQSFSFGGLLHAPAALSQEIQTSKYILNATFKFSKSFRNKTGGKKRVITSDPTTFSPQSLPIPNLIEI
jgi:hypothetical protein